MKEQDRVARNKERLEQLYPTFRTRVERVIKELEARGYRPRIQDAYRSPADQLRAYNSGHSKLKYGFHNVTGTGGKPEALAVDLLDDDNPLNPSKHYLLTLARVAYVAGVTTGIDWGLPAAMRAKLATAVRKGLLSADEAEGFRIGWDPTHIEPMGMTAAQARRGDRPK